VSDTLELAKEVSEKAPWWATAPIWLAAGIVGVPSLMAIGAGYFIAQTVVRNQRTLEQYNLSELHILNEVDKDNDLRWNAMRQYIIDDLRAQYQTCIHAAKNSSERNDCLTPQSRMEEYGIGKKKVAAGE
jgi:hypothetical protein